MPRLLERRQAIAETHPCEIVTQPGVVRWRKQIGVVEAASRYIDKAHAITMFVR
jgi:hypothetical protein